jgi:hypothetical protein
MSFDPRRIRRTTRWCALASAATALAGCTQLLGIEPLGERPPDANPAEPPVDARPVDARVIDSGIDTTCSEGTIENATGATPIDTAPAGNDLMATCGGESSPDQMLLWTAPVTDYYVFDTFGSGFDTVLALFGECGGAELACSNNVGDVGQSEVVHKFRQGEQALVLIDGTAGDSGEGVLNIQPVTCPEADLEGQTFPLELTTLQSADDFSSQCGGVDQEDRAFHWVAPADGMYYFHVTSDSFIPIVALLDGPRCTDRVLGCNAAQQGDFGAEVVRFLRAGEPVTIVVDGKEGAGLFRLDVGLREGESCPEAVLSEAVTDDFTARSLAPSCTPALPGGSFGGIYAPPDKSYSFVVSGVGNICFGSCNVSVTAMQDVVIYALEGDDCGGAEVACQVAQVDPASGRATATVGFPSAAEDTVYTIVVSDLSEFGGGGFTLEPFCAVACP